jgi:hypothetical protein
MNKFTVVVPTMWRYAPFLNFLCDLVRFPMVDDIIIINNDITQTPANDILMHEKIRIVEHTSNVYVNPAWNEGVAMARNDKVCILNDDMIFDLRVFYHVDVVLNEHSGAVGICPGLEEFNQPKFESGSIKVIPWTNQHMFGFGTLMFVNKAWWIDIPLDFVLYYGDNWIFDTCLIRNRQNYLITDVLHHTPYASTCKDLPVANDMLVTEESAFNWHKQNFIEWVRMSNNPVNNNE